MKYKVTTSYRTGAGDTSHDDEWLFNTRGEAQKFVDEFHKAFPKNKRSMDNPYIYSSMWRPEIEEIDDTPADPYAWLEKQIEEREKRKK